MPKDKKEITNCKNNQPLVKANEIIQESKSALTVQQKKLLANMLSSLKEQQNDVNNISMLFNMKEYCNLVGIDYNDPMNYSSIKEDLEKLRDTSWWIPLEGENGEVIDTLVSWIQKVRVCEEDELLYVEMDEDLAPFLFDGIENYIPLE